MPPTLQGAVEPMQIDVDPQEDPQNAPDVNYVVENPTLVGGWRALPDEGGGGLGVSPAGGSRPGSPLWPSFSRPETCSVSDCPRAMVVSTAGDPHSSPTRRARVLGVLQVRLGLPQGPDNEALSPLASLVVQS